MATTQSRMTRVAFTWAQGFRCSFVAPSVGALLHSAAGVYEHSVDTFTYDFLLPVGAVREKGNTSTKLWTSRHKSRDFFSCESKWRAPYKNKVGKCGFSNIRIARHYWISTTGFFNFACSGSYPRVRISVFMTVRLYPCVFCHINPHLTRQL